MIEIIPNWHPIFVHFTVALLSLAVLLQLLARILPMASVRSEWLIVARWSLWLGTLLAIVTAIAGWYAYNSVAHDDVSHAAMTEHRNWALVTLALFSVLALWSLQRWWKQRAPDQGKVGVVFLLGLTVGGVLLASTAWRGGELVYRHGLGVMSLPVVEVEEAGHAHGHEHGAQAPPSGEASMPAAAAPGMAKPPAHDSTPHTH